MPPPPRIILFEIFVIATIDSFDVNNIDYFWKPKVDVIVLDPEMSEFELSDYKGERKQVKYVIGKIIV